MPEKYFHISWPNGDEERCYSPSSVITQYLDEHTDYELSEFVALADSALTEASERVRAKYGYACSSAMDQLGRIKRKASTFSGDEFLEVRVNVRVNKIT